MKFIRFLGVLLLLIPCVSMAADTTEFQNASKLLTAARRGDIQTVQVLINNGVDVNYVDATGMSLVCTAVMNNDKRAIQVLQMYGADASQCDRQIKKYKQKTKMAESGEEYGFFSGLSSTHVIALSALGVAAVVGGVVLLAKVFDKDNDNHSSGGSGDRPNNNNNENTSTNANKLFAQNLPYGPACSGTSCPNDFSFWETTKKVDFDYMSDNISQDTVNYLMVAHAYDAFVRGYLGMTTIRIASDLTPFDLKTLPYIEDAVPNGGEPINVAAITASGVNATGSAVAGSITWVDSTQITTVQSVCNQYGSNSTECQNELAAATKTSNKYYNLSGGTENAAFDLSGSGTVFGLATDSDTKLAKIIAGWEYGGRATGDFYGFIPNGQLSVYKTGNGAEWKNPSAPASGTYHIDGTTLVVGDTFGLFGETLTVSSVDGGNFVATSGNKTYHGYIIDNDRLFIDSGADGNINQMYVFEGTGLTLSKELGVSDYKNYAAIKNAINLKNGDVYVSDVIANLALVSGAESLDYWTVGTSKIIDNELTTLPAKKLAFLNSIGIKYNLNPDDDTLVNGNPADDAKSVFETLPTANQILVNPAGRSLYGSNSGQSIFAQEATFENFAPAIYSDLQNLFMTVVAVTPKNGTKGDTISGYSAANSGKLELSTWADDNSVVYSSRICGLTGNGNNGAMNPWCFSAPGVSDLDATAAMAGSVALVKSAFSYMNPEQIFLLLALTADGPYLGTDPNTNLAWTSQEVLISYLKNMYSMPANFNSSDAQYLESFKQVFGYGMINLERATRPGTNIFYFSSKDSIVSSAGNSYWRNAPASSSRASSVLSLAGRSAIKTAFFDVIESADGEISLPRVWNATFTENGKSKRGLYMGDVLGDFDIDSTSKRTNQIGNFTFDMALSSRAYNDNLNGLDDLHIAFNSEDYNVDMGYQRFLTDGESRFNGRANGVLALVANSVSTGAGYKVGNFVFGGRAFSGYMTDENLLENDPGVSSQFEPGRLGIANGVSIDAGYNTKKFAVNVAVGNLHETNTVLGMYSDGILTMRGGDTRYVDTVVMYKPTEDVKLSVRGTFANTTVNEIGGLISNISDIKSNAFALGADIGGFGFTVAMPLAAISGKMGYDYAEYDVVENDGRYDIAINNPHVEYVDLSKENRELRFSGYYKTSVGKFTDAGVGFMYRVHPDNCIDFGNESIFMFKVQHRVGI